MLNNPLIYRGHINDLSNVNVLTLASGYYMLNAVTTNNTEFDPYSPVLIIRRESTSGNAVIIGLNKSATDIAVRRVLTS